MVAGTLVTQLGIWTEMLIQKGVTSDLRSQETACERIRFRAHGAAYVLRGDDDAGAVPRVAISDTPRAPIAFLTPVPDLHKALASPGKQAPIAGYALLTLDGEIHTAWRIYDAIPDDVTLVRDVTAAVNGRIRPALRVQGTQVQFILPPHAPR